MKHATMRRTLGLAAVLLSANAMMLGSRPGMNVGLDALSAEVAEVVQGRDVSGGQSPLWLIQIIMDLACLSCMATIPSSTDWFYEEFGNCLNICAAAY